MVVKNIAVSVFGVEYLKSHSVKGKASNKTKSIPRPAIDPTKALAIRDIFEYYLKNEKNMTGQALMIEVDSYEESIRQKISDLIRPPRQTNKDLKKKEAIQKHITKKTSELNKSTNIDNTNPNIHDNLPTGLEKSPVGEVSSSESSSEESDEESNSAGEDSMEQEKK
ncbi:uncharacterized protein LOC123261560 isoform X2 [Cotesia glomerata]|uniref:BEN domain-containing protein n=2 Tax=Cotesia glomerata TaxID=32391 RepID=A0AAV7IDZ2_COTGL|nr:uncharacterized protein LOC123261560 isoform X2 [Cotesia glomerata]XP_044579147.1 uncharacterized protein LOC123261560 isoform X2 [Cotesia glomerata]XP_044579148.1 uncharacterized protein LOC123261560 isoform X2 [Cotesia glomerata]KAH0549868.1 hypothetical protein KQX54_015435 [Cotesia glomerata]